MFPSQHRQLMCRAVFVQGGAAPGAAAAGDEPDGGDDARAAGALGGADGLPAHAEAHRRNHRKHMSHGTRDCPLLLHHVSAFSVFVSLPS